MKKVVITIKSYMIIFLVIIALHAIITIQNYNFLIQLVLSPIFAAIIDILITYAKDRKTFVPSSAIISGLFIALILPLMPIINLLFVALISMLSKHIIKIKAMHIFNPAVFGIVVGGVIFNYTASWWAAISFLSIPFGLFIIYKQKKWLLALSFVILYLALLVVFSSISTIVLLDTTMLFFAFFMLIEPMTSAYTKKAMIAEGVMVAILVTLARLFLPQLDLFLLSLLVANIFVPALNKKLI